MKLGLIGLAIVAVLAGCAGRPRDDGFGDVRRAVGERMEGRIVWDRGSAEDRAARQGVRGLLARELDVDSAVQVALLNNARLQAAYEELGVSQAELVQAGLLRNPVFDLSARFPDRRPRGPNVEISITDEFLDLLMMPARKRLAAAQFEAAKARVGHQVLALAADVRVAFFQVQAAVQMVEMRRSVVDAAAAAAEMAKRLREAGNTNELALTSQQAMYAQAKLELAAAEAEALDARERLNVLMGTWGEQTEWKVAARLAELPGREVSPSGLESLAVARRLDLAAARQAVEAAARSLGLATQFRFIQGLDIGVDTERDPGGQRVTGPTVSVPIPLFDQGQAVAAAGQARLRQARQQYLALAVQVRAQVRAARNRLLAARARAEFYRGVMLPLRQRVVEESQLQFNGMQLGVFQLLEAKQGQIEAGRAYLEALRDYWVARAELERAVGGKLPEGSLAAAATMPASQPAGHPAEPQGHEHHH